MQSLRDERSRAFTPLGEDMAGASLVARLSGNECYRRLVCLRFDIDYMSLPLGAQGIFYFHVSCVPAGARAVRGRRKLRHGS